VGHHLVASVRAGGDDCVRVRLVDRIGHAARPGCRGVGGEAVVLGDVGGGDAVRAELLRGVACARADQQRFEPAPSGHAARQRQRLQRQLVRATALVFNQNEHSHVDRPDFWPI
jgi:hypothetical protein